MNFEETMTNAVQQSILKGIKEVKFFDHWHKNRLGIPDDIVQQAYASIDREKILNLVREQIEQQIAKTIVGQLLTETATDTKRIMSDVNTRKAIKEKYTPFIFFLRDQR